MKKVQAHANTWNAIEQVLAKDLVRNPGDKDAQQLQTFLKGALQYTHGETEPTIRVSDAEHALIEAAFRRVLRTQAHWLIVDGEKQTLAAFSTDLSNVASHNDRLRAQSRGESVYEPAYEPTAHATDETN